MSKVASSMSMSLDGYVTGPNDSRKNPLGEGGEVLHHWLGPTATDADREVLQEDGRRLRRDPDGSALVRLLRR
jgi:hypothetical protein